jgi:hypothetical protein
MTIQLILNTILILLLVLLLLVALIKNNIIILLITLIIFIIILPTIIINKFIIKYIINKRVVARKYLYKLSKYIYSTIHYDMNEVYEIYELNEMNRIFEIKNKIIDLHKTYYKYNSYSHVITNIEKELIIFKEKDLTNQMILNINNQKLLLSQNELYELIIMKKNGLKTDMFIYKSYLKDFFKSLNEINEIICYV